VNVEFGLEASLCAWQLLSRWGFPLTLDRSVLRVSCHVIAAFLWKKPVAREMARPRLASLRSQAYLPEYGAFGANGSDLAP
jgi:hypothetical protein